MIFMFPGRSRLFKGTSTHWNNQNIRAVSESHRFQNPNKQTKNSPPVFIETRRAGRDSAQEGALSRHFQKPPAMESDSEGPGA